MNHSMFGGVAILIATVLVNYAAYTQEAPRSFLVTEFGARGDGSTDDTSAIQSALDAAGKAGGGEVFLPAGKYRVGASLTVPSGVTLRGVWEAPHHSDRSWGTTLLAVGGRGQEEGPPAVELQPSSTLRGITIFYPDQSIDDVRPYPWAVRGSGMNCSVLDVTLVAAYQGINFGYRHHELHTIRGVYGCVLRRGIYVDQCTDIGRIENVHINPHYWARADAPNAPKDGGQYAVWVEQTQTPGLLITNGEFVTFSGKAPVELVTTESFKGVVQLSNCSFWGPTRSCAELRGPGFVSFQQCNFCDWSKDDYAIRATNGDVIISDSRFGQAKPHVLLEGGLVSAIIKGNRFRGPLRIDNTSQAQVELGLNIADKPRSGAGQ
jgi:hypothetical protein